MIRTLVLPLTVFALAGCATLAGSLGIRPATPVDIEVLPQFRAGTFQTQALVTPHSSASVDHLVVSLHRRVGGGEEAVRNGLGLPVEKDVASGSFSVPLTFKDLHQSTSYRIRAHAYAAPGRNGTDLISDPGSSYVDLDVGMDDRPPLAVLPVKLADRMFAGEATSSIAFTPGQLGHTGVERITFQGATPPPRPVGTLGTFVSHGVLPYALDRSAAFQVGNKLYLLGGSTSNGGPPTGVTKQILVATISETGELGTFTELSGRTLVTARCGHFATRVGDYLYVIGGLSYDENTAMASVERARITPEGDLEAFAIVPGSALNTPRGLFTGLNTGTYVYAIGGKVGYLQTVERAKIQADGSLGPFVTDPIRLETGRMTAAGVWIGTNFYVIGGETHAATQLRTIERATLKPDGTLGAFTMDNRLLSRPRNRMGVAALANVMYFFGGYDNGFLSQIDSTTIQPDDTLGAFSFAGGTQLVTGLENGITFMTSSSVYYIGGYNFSLLKTIQRAPIQ
ncbi:Kelch motif protein [compost metagenome]